jgi:uncharacterized protein YndB with AHSA1/START domain
MTDLATLDGTGVLTDPATLQFRRLLPGPIERVWAYLTEGELRRRWLAAGDMTLEVGAPFEFVWRNDELTDPPGQRPAGADAEHRMTSRITALDPPLTLGFSWGEHGNVTIALTPRGDEVLLVLTHAGVPDQATLLGVSSGWHSHLDLLDARARGIDPTPFWDSFARLRAEYAQRFAPAA